MVLGYLDKMARRVFAALICGVLGGYKERDIIGDCSAEVCNDDGCEERKCVHLKPADPKKKEVSGYIISCTG